MAKKKTEIQTEFNVDASQFDSSIKQMSSDIKLLTNQLKLNSTQLKGNSGDVDLLQQRQELLTIELQKHTQKVEDISNKLEQTKLLYGENSQAVRNQTNELLKAQTQQEATRNELNGINQKIEEVTNSLTENTNSSTSNANAYNRLTNEISEQEEKLSVLKKSYSNAILEFGESSVEATNLQNDLSKLNQELTENKQKLDNVDKASNKVTNSLKDVDNACDSVDSGFSVMKGALADLTASAIEKAIGGISDLVGSILDLSDATEEYRSMNAKLEGSANSWGYSTDFATEKYKEFYSYLGDSQMSTNAITNLMGIGLETDKVSKLAEGAIGVWASYGDSIPIESLTESINETIQVGKVTGTMADTINWAKVSNEDFSKALGEGSKAQKAFNNAIKDGESTEDAFSAALAATNDTQERANIVANFLNNTYGKSKSTYDDMTEGIRNANSAEADLMDVQSQMADVLDPVNNAFTSLKTETLEKMIPIVEDVTSAFFDLNNYLDEHKGVATILKGVVVALAAGFGVLAVALGIQKTIEGVSKAMSFLNATMSANPIVFIIAGITALVVGFLYLWNNCESFRNFWIGLWDGLVSFFSTAKDKVIDGFNSIVDFVKLNWQGLLLFIVNPFAGAFKLLYDNCDGFRNKVNELKDKVVGTFSGIANTLKNIFHFNINLPKIKMPHFSITPRGWKIGDLMKGKIPRLSVDWYAKGAVFTKPTILNTSSGYKGVGEAGSETVLPLSVLDQKIQNSMAKVLENSNLELNSLGFDNVIQNTASDSVTNYKIDKACQLLEKIANKSYSFYVDSTELARATSNAADEISGELIELKDRGLEL